MTKIKICGLSRIEDIHSVNEAKPDYIGFVFAASKRQVSLEQAAHLKSLLSEEIKAVGVFVNDDIDFIEKLCRKNIIDLIQLHGTEDEKYVDNIKAGKKLKNPIIKAVRVEKKEDVIYPPADYILFDTYSKGRYGGTGRSFDWELVKNYEKPFFLAGGIGLDNVKSAMEKTRPYCLDISSGVETYEKKDKEKIIKIVNIVRGGN